MSVGTMDARGHVISHSTDVATRVGRSLKLDLQLSIHRPPQSVRAWWTDLPDEYVAKDPREQPHRIRVLARDGNRIDLVGTWRGPSGRRGSSRRPSVCARMAVGPSMPGPWDSGFTMSSRLFPAGMALDCRFEAPSHPPGPWDGSSRGSWGDAFCACWQEGGQRRPRFASEMHRDREGGRMQQLYGGTWMRNRDGSRGGARLAYP